MSSGACVDDHTWFTQAVNSYPSSHKMTVNLSMCQKHVTFHKAQHVEGPDCNKVRPNEGGKWKLIKYPLNSQHQPYFPDLIWNLKVWRKYLRLLSKTVKHFPPRTYHAINCSSSSHHLKEGKKQENRKMRRQMCAPCWWVRKILNLNLNVSCHCSAYESPRLWKQHEFGASP